MFWIQRIHGIQHHGRHRLGWKQLSPTSWAIKIPNPSLMGFVAFSQQKPFSSHRKKNTRKATSNLTYDLCIFYLNRSVQSPSDFTIMVGKGRVTPDTHNGEDPQSSLRFPIRSPTGISPPVAPSPTCTAMKMEFVTFDAQEDRSGRRVEVREERIRLLSGTPPGKLRRL